jgi:hypothetical protein
MKTPNIAYDLCRHYIVDRKGTLPTEIYNKVHGFLRNRSLSQLATCSTLSNPAKIGLEGWRTLMQTEAFFKKNVSFSDPEVCLANALSSYQRGERICRITNKRLDYYYFKRDRIDPDLEKQMSNMEKYVQRIMGNHRTFLDNLPKLVRVTAGATSTKSRRRSLPHLRISMRPVASSGASLYLNALSRYYGYGQLDVQESETNRVEFVPKNWKTYRTIACEPEGNVFLQLAVDRYVKDRLRRMTWTPSGALINLRSQFRNQEMAREGSISGNFSTIDLSMASDTLALNTIAWLMPSDWFRFLDRIRSRKSGGQLPETNYAKFSSMGNGATFVLETLVFAAAAHAVGSKAYSVYGDDIVIETELAEPLIRLLRFIGFVVNHDKTFLTGPFRESCGVNMFQGVDITPVYIRKLDRRKATWCHLVNSLAAIAKPGGDLWKELIRIVSEKRLPLVPYNLDTMSGVWVNTRTSRQMKLIQSRNWILRFKAYQSVGQNCRARGVRSAFLWHLDVSNRRKLIEDEECPFNFDRVSSQTLLMWKLGDLVRCESEEFDRESHYAWKEMGNCTIRSWYTISSHKYRRRWVHYREVVAGAPDHLDWWSEDVVPAQA